MVRNFSSYLETGLGNAMRMKTNFMTPYQIAPPLKKDMEPENQKLESGIFVVGKTHHFHFQNFNFGRVFVVGFYMFLLKETAISVSP